MKQSLLLLIFILTLHSHAAERTNSLKSYSLSVQVNDELEQSQHLGICFIKINNFFYDLHLLADKLAKYEFNSKNGQKISFNFCNNVKTNCESSEGLVVSEDRCKKFAGQENLEKSWTVETDSKGNNILIAKLPKGDVCERNKNGVTNYETSFRLICDEKQEGSHVVNSLDFNPSKCVNEIQIATKYACKHKKFSAWWNQFGINKNGLALLMIISGLYFLIFGGFFWQTNSLIINSLITGLVMYNIISLFTKISIVVCLLLGIALSILVLFFEAANASVLGVVVGYILGNILYNFHIRPASIDPQSLYWLAVISQILIMSVLGSFVKDYMVRAATSLVGAYSAVRGVSIFLGGYPDEQYVMMLIIKKEFNQFTRVYGPAVYHYQVAIVLLALLGLIFQSCCCVVKKPEPAQDKTEEPPSNNIQVLETPANSQNLLAHEETKAEEAVKS